MIKLTVDFSTETKGTGVEGEERRINNLKMLKEDTCQPRILYQQK